MPNACQGFGNVGSFAASIFAERGAKIIAVSDIEGAVHQPKGLDVTSLRAHVREGKRLDEFSGGALSIPKSEILQVPCDILVPAAIGGVITADNALTIHSTYIVEAANGPITPEADRILQDRGIVVLPDIYANGGGVTVSFFEWVQNLQNFKWEEVDVNAKLARKMEVAFEEIWRVAKEKQLSLRTAAFVIAVQRVARAAIHRGFG